MTPQEACGHALPGDTQTPASPGQAVLRLRGQEYGLEHPVVMAIINRTTDSFYPGARQADDNVAHEAVAAAVVEGADIIDVGGIKAAPGEDIGVAEEIDRVIGFVGQVRQNHPDVLVSVDTWRAEVARAACEAGADLINDTWAGHDPDVAGVAGQYGVGLVCSHTGGATPRTRPFRVSYGHTPEAVVADVIATVTAQARRAVELGVDPQAILIDPTHDFGKNTWHGLTLLRHTSELVNTGFCVLMALSRKDFIGETVGAPVTERLPGSLAAAAVAVWLGAQVVRTHDVAATRQALDMVASIRGDRPPIAVTRGLA